MTMTTHRLILSASLLLLLLSATACRTVNCTDRHVAHENCSFWVGLANCFEFGVGGLGGGFSPNIGNIDVRGGCIGR